RREWIAIVHRRERSLVTILHKTRNGVQHSRQFRKRVIALPFGARVSTVYRFFPIERGIPFWDNAVVDVKDISLAVGINHIVNVLLQLLHSFKKLGKSF